jgi:hypothetical protein
MRNAEFGMRNAKKKDTATRKQVGGSKALMIYPRLRVYSFRVRLGSCDFEGIGV